MSAPPTFVIHVHSRDLYANTPKRPPRSKAICFRCGEQGHTRDQCFSYRVAMCTRPHCSDPNCMHAHSAKQLRTPHVERCVRVIKNKSTGEIYRLGCQGSHTFRRCPNKVCSVCGAKGHWYDECSRK